MGSSVEKGGGACKVYSTVGIVSGLHRRCGDREDLVQTDALLMRGFSGGALLDLDVHVVAVLLGGDLQMSKAKPGQLDQTWNPEDSKIDYALTNGSGAIAYAVPVEKAVALLRQSKVNALK